MCSLVLGIACLCLFFVPLIPPFLGILALITAVKPFRTKRRRLMASIGLVCSMIGNALFLWVWRFGHLP